MADYDPDWGRRMQQRYGVSEADLADPDTRAYLQRRARKDNTSKAAAATQPAETPQTPQTQVDPAPPKGGGGACPDGSMPRTMPCIQPPCPQQCADGSTPGQKAGGDPRYPAPPGGGYPGYPGPGGYPGPYGMPPPAAGFGYAVYGGPGTQQPGRGGPGAGYRGAMNYPQVGNTYPLYGTGARPGAQPNYGYPNQYPQGPGPYGGFIPPGTPQQAADALQTRRM
jgi:hypothetical protein